MCSGYVNIQTSRVSFMKNKNRKLISVSFFRDIVIYCPIFIKMSNRNMRDVSWIVQKIRHALLGREWNKLQLRHKNDLSSRSPPHPMLPDGPAHRLSGNSYVKRDTRCLVTPPKDYVNVLHDGKKIEGKVGQTLMSAAKAAGVEIEAACDASDEEEDMLDLALFVQPTSRLSCQIILTPEIDGVEFKCPTATRNFYAGEKDEKTSGTNKDSLGD